MRRSDSALGEAALRALESIYVACCLSCRHTAVRYNAITRAYECDWCKISEHQVRYNAIMQAYECDGCSEV